MNHQLIGCSSTKGEESHSIGPVGKSASAVLPTVVGLASIPVIIGPIDRGVDFAMDRTVRGITTELLAKADVKPDPSN